MKTLFRFVLAILVLFVQAIGYGQSSSGLKYPKQPTREIREVPSKLWYGGGLNLGFSGRAGLTIMQLGASPMVGYKLLPRLSVGPRVSFLASRYSGKYFLNKITPIDWGVGLFTRVKLFSPVFAHAEYELANQAFVSFDGVNGNRLVADRVAQRNVYVGGGYSSGEGPTRFEIVGLYNLQPPQSDQYFISPFTFRFGFTVNF